MNISQYIENGSAVMGIELGSTRIKAVLIGSDHSPIASGGYNWENKLENGIWTYGLDEVWTGVRAAFAELKQDVRDKYGVEFTQAAAIGVSAMMHGYLVFDAAGKQLAQFRTWRNTMTGASAAELTELFGFNIPQRWSIAHLYQAILNKESHVSEIAHMTTLAGYIHWMLTGEKVLGVGEASGMFPIDSDKRDFNADMLDKFSAKVAGYGYPWNVRDILPRVACAGDAAGSLTEEGALMLDPTGAFKAGCPMCPPEGDAGTGMTATNAVAERTGNVSAGTSVFAMIVLERPLSKVYPEIDMVTTPTGKPVAMAHCNNCTSDINAWAGMLKGFCDAAGLKADMNDIYTSIFNAALEGDKDCGGVINLPLFSGEHVIGLDEGRPMLVRMPDAKMTFANFSRSIVSGAMASLRVGMNILANENVKIDSLLGHGGFFKTPIAGQRILAAALNTPVSVMETAGEGGPWGMALLAAYSVRRSEGQTLEDYLNKNVFAASGAVTEAPIAEDVAGFNAYTDRFVQALDAEKAAIAALK